MIMYPYNKSSVEGRRLSKLLSSKYNEAQISPSEQDNIFRDKHVESVMQCRANKTTLIVPSNLSGIKRPQVHISADVEKSWGDYSNDINSLDFTHGQELPITYVQPIDDDTMKLLVDAGMYEDERFEELISKLISNDVFDVESEMQTSLLDIYNEDGNRTPVMFVEPMHVVYDDLEIPENTTASNLMQRAARLAIDLRNENIKTEEIIKDGSYDMSNDAEVMIVDDIQDFKESSVELEQSEGFKVKSELLDQEIDVTDKMKDVVLFGTMSEDEKIRALRDEVDYDKVIKEEQAKQAENEDANSGDNYFESEWHEHDDEVAPEDGSDNNAFDAPFEDDDDIILDDLESLLEPSREQAPDSQVEDEQELER